MGKSRDDNMLPAIHAVLEEAGTSPTSLNAIVCGAGPGSFTSLRISASIAKGLATGISCPLFVIPSLVLAAASVQGVGEFVVHADAMRGERFAQPVRIDTDGTVHAAGPHVRVAYDLLAEFVDNRGIPLRRVAVISSSSPGDEFMVVTPDAGRALGVGEWFDNGPVDLASWEPDYGRLAEAQVKWEAQHGKLLQDSQP